MIVELCSRVANQEGGASDGPLRVFYGWGKDGQYLVIIPSRDLVVVRLGLTHSRGAWDLEGFLADVLAAVPAPGSH